MVCYIYTEELTPYEVINLISSDYVINSHVTFHNYPSFFVSCDLLKYHQNQEHVRNNIMLRKLIGASRAKLFVCHKNIGLNILVLQIFSSYEYFKEVATKELPGIAKWKTSMYLYCSIYSYLVL